VPVSDALRELSEAHRAELDLLRHRAERAEKERDEARRALADWKRDLRAALEGTP
jgi:hypothetical protein